MVLPVSVAVAAGADPHAVNGDGCNLLQFAVRGLGGNPLNLALIKYLIEDVKVKPTVSKHGTERCGLLDCCCCAYERLACTWPELLLLAVGALVACGCLSSLADSVVALSSRARIRPCTGDNLLHEVLMQFGRVFDNHADAPEVGGCWGSGFVGSD